MKDEEGLLPRDGLNKLDNEGPMRESAHGVLKRRIERLRLELAGYEAMRKVLDHTEPGSPLEEILWKMLTGL